MREIAKTLACKYKRRIFTKKTIHKILSKDILDIYELYTYKRLNSKKNLKKIINIDNLVIDNYDFKIIQHLNKQFLSHRFDILGSGWVNASQKTENTKQLTHNSITHNKFLLNLEKGYTPICWNKDLKTGYEFSIDTIYKAGLVEGLPKQVDIKVCWDLARMHHLVLLSIFSLVNKDKANILEFKNQVIDFCNNNPIGYGINWCGSMDASIRAVNLLIAYDIFKQIDNEDILNDEFRCFFSNNLYQHGRFILNHLEADLLHGKNHNHYLSNIVGLLYISAYLNDSNTKSWWNFALKEFYCEIDKQFFEDGCNYEGSTSYHRLSGEMFVYGLAIIKRIEGCIPENIMEKLWKAAFFSKTIKKQNERVVQIGDNDSGRFLKFTIQGELISSKEAEKKYLNLKGYTNQFGDEEYFDEDFLNHDTFISCVAGLIDSPEFTEEKNKYPLEFSVIKSIAHSSPIDRKYVTTINDSVNKHIDYTQFSNTIINSITFEEPLDLTINGRWLVFENFGLCAYKSDTIDFYIYAGRKNKIGINSHIHNDKLHFEFCLKDKEFFCDPGTGVYASNIKLREMFRSYKIHNVPDYGFDLDEVKSIFYLDEKSNCQIVSLDGNSISLFLYTDKISHLRKVTINKNSISIEDRGSEKFDINLKEPEYFSNGYGKIIKKNINDLKLKYITKKETLT